MITSSSATPALCQPAPQAGFFIPLTLHNLKKRHEQGRTTRCLPCAIAQTRLLAKEREKPSRKSRRKADLLAAKGWSHPIVRPQIPIPEPLELKPAAAQLPTGIVSAATAWPRPGRASA